MTDVTEPDPILAYYLDAGPDGGRYRLTPCPHCTNRTHETLRFCTFCGHQMASSNRDNCLCSACLHDPHNRQPRREA